jgi:hypothetical protein
MEGEPKEARSSILAKENQLNKEMKELLNEGLFAESNQEE